MINNFYEASILPSVRSSINPFLQIILALNLLCGMELNEFCPPNSSDDLFLLSCLFLLLCFLNVVHNLGTWIPKLGKVWRKPASWGRLAAIARPSTAANWNHNTTASLVIEHIHCRVHQIFLLLRISKGWIRGMPPWISSFFYKFVFFTFVFYTFIFNNFIFYTFICYTFFFLYVHFLYVHFLYSSFFIRFIFYNSKFMITT